MSESHIIIGGGGHTRVLLGMLQAAGLPVAGIITSDPALRDSRIFSVPVLGLQGEVALPPGHLLVNGVGNRASRRGSGLETRMQLFYGYQSQGGRFASVISGHAVVQPEVRLGEGVQLMPGAVVQPGAVIGDNSIINTRAAVDHDVHIGAHTHIAPGAVICGGVTIGDQTHIGAGAVVIQGIRIGSNVMIGAGVVVRHHVSDGAIVAA